MRAEKAVRLVEQDRVIPVQSRSFLVKGDTGTYMVSILTATPKGYTGTVVYRLCNCDFALKRPGSVCSHIAACAIFMENEKRAAIGHDPFQGLTEATR